MEVKRLRLVDINGYPAWPVDDCIPGERWVAEDDFDRVTAERDALQIRITSTDDHNDRLIAAINKVRNSIGLPVSIEAVLIAALDRKEKTDEQ